MRSYFFAAAAAWMLLAPAAFAQTETGLQAAPEEMQWFREARFGLFIHWGPVSLQGTEIGWSRGGERKYPPGKGEVPVEVYDNLYKQFNPTEFDAEEWVRIAQAAGTKYLVFTTKHHDGFCMFDSETTGHKITNSPFGRDVVKELADACHKAGIKLGFYYSPPDWRHPDYFADTHARYIEYMHNHVRELCTKYGKVDVLWFDGLGAPPERWDAANLIPQIRKWQPGIVINNRAGLPADYDTPEQEVGRFQNNRAWESCITIGDQWAWKPGDRVKSFKECIDILVRCAGGDGNLLFNVGPMPNGEIEDRQVERLLEIGAWLKNNGESIYATRGGPFLPGTWGASTYKGSTVYVHILLDPKEHSTLRLPPIDRQITASRFLTGEGSVRQTEDAIEIAFKPESLDAPDTVVVLELDSPAEGIKPIAVTDGQSLAANRNVKASNVYENNDWAYGAQKAFDDNPSTRWATDSTDPVWLEVDLEKPQTFRRAVIMEYGSRTQQFELQRKEGDSWVTFHRGETLGDKSDIRFEPVTAQTVRLLITKATEAPSIWEFQIFEK